MIEEIKQLQAEINNIKTTDLKEIENIRIKYLSKKGILNDLFHRFKTIPDEEKKVVGKALNNLKTLITERINTLASLASDTSNKKNNYDITLPVFINLGTRHPLSIIRNQIITIFNHLGFNVSEGPEIEDDWHVFSALNFPPEHPARDMQDTFFIKNMDNSLLRTHTSSVQVRVMEKQKVPIRTISPGRVYRNEAISARAHCIFHQVEGLYIDKNVSFADLKQTLLYFAKEMFGKTTKIRLRPSYFPFTEPSAEMDISCKLCGGKGCNVCKYTGWVEILGCGMVDPNVLESNNISSKEYSGFAFGMGVERIAMLKYGINDLRLFFENNLEFLNQFKANL